MVRGSQRAGVSAIAGVAALAVTLSGIALTSPAGAVVSVDRPGPALQAMGSERVLTFAPAAATSGQPPSKLSAASFTKSAVEAVVGHATALGLVGSVADVRTIVNFAGDRRIHLQQSIGGVPVMGGEAVVDLNASGQTRSIVSEFLPGAAPTSLKPSITSAEAFARYVRSSTRVSGGGSHPHLVSTQLTIFDPRIFGAPGVPRATLVWRLTVDNPKVSQGTRTVLVDAHRGSIVLDIANSEELANVAVCDDQNAPNSPYTIGCGQIDHQGTTLSTVRATSTPSGNADVDGAYDNSTSTLQFYSDYLGRDSVNGRGQPITSIVNFCASTASSSPCPYPNAYWDGEKILFGQGFAAADDVVAHEISHGLTQDTARLLYYYQSGAISESLSDIYGEFVDQTDGHDLVGDATSNLWQLGEDLTWVDSTGTTVSGPIRHMQDPTNAPESGYAQPDSMTSPLYGIHNPWDQNSAGYSLFDSGDVHQNSGVGNKFAYLLTDTTPSNPLGVGVGIGKAVPIIFGAEQLLTSGADYRALAAALRLSCSALLGKTTPHGDVISQADCLVVDRAIKAVKMDSTPRGTRAVAAICPSGRKVKTLWHDDMEHPTSGHWVKSTVGGKATPALWYYGSQPISYYGNMWIGPYSTSGRNELWGDDPDPGDYYRTSNGQKHYIFGTPKAFADHREAMKVSVLIPRGVPTFMRFNHSFGFETAPISSGLLRPDGGLVEYSIDAGKTWLDARSLMSGSINNGYNGHIDYWVGAKDVSLNPVVNAKHPTRPAFIGQSKGYQSTRAVLTSLAGKKVRVRFRITADQMGGEFGWAIDDVSFYSCIPA